MCLCVQSRIKISYAAPFHTDSVSRVFACVGERKMPHFHCPIVRTAAEEIETVHGRWHTLVVHNLFSVLCCPVLPRVVRYHSLRL